MNGMLDKTALWSYREAAEVLGLPAAHGLRTVSELVTAHGLQPKRTPNPRVKGLDRRDLDFLAKLLNKTIDWPDRQA